MKTSLGGHSLPESHAEAQALHADGKLLFSKCFQCQLPLYTADAAKSLAGWRETQISSTCETCFDAMFEEDADEAGF